MERRAVLKLWLELSDRLTEKNSSLRATDESE
jgi:hypothetical protein